MLPCNCVLAKRNRRDACSDEQNQNQPKGSDIIPQYKITKNRVFIQVLVAAILHLRLYFESHNLIAFPFLSKNFPSCIGPHKKGF